MKFIGRGSNLKHRQLQHEGYLQRGTAKKGEYAGACALLRMTETDITNTNDPTGWIAITNSSQR